jgi:hypothetical protein
VGWPKGRSVDFFSLNPRCGKGTMALKESDVHELMAVIEKNAE